MRAPISGRRKARASPEKEKKEKREVFPPPGRVSGSLKKAQTSAVNESEAAARPGALSERPTVKPAIAGPKMNPRPKAIPTRPMPRARSWGLVVSAMTACAVPMFPPVAPSRRRDAKSTGKERANAKSR